MKTKFSTVEKENKAKEGFSQKKNTSTEIIKKPCTKEEAHKSRKRVANVILPDLE